ncbi:MAG: PilZ domain-containing protein [Beijerinckiaceae bacterium]|nr:PilZ domain-containing protein [Beijerinckiaceae bacterium]
MDEQRKVMRARTVYRGSIVFNNNNSTIDCLVRNFSELGAKIIVDESITFPQQFQLLVPQKGRTFTAMVIWRAGQEVGVEFQDEKVNGRTLPVGSGDIGDQMRVLEKENAKLKKLVADLQMQVNRSQQAG